MIFSGTIATRGSYPPEPYNIEIRLEDPASGRSIRHAFGIDMLPALQA